jgi:hypothetical protein
MNANDNNKSDLSRQQPGQGAQQQRRDEPGKQAPAPGEGQGEAANETRKADRKDSDSK